MQTEETLSPTNEPRPAEPAQTPADGAAAELVQTDDVKKIIETLLFITDRPVKATRIADVVETVTPKQAAEIVAELTKEYAARGSAVQIVEIAGGYQMSTKPEYGRWVRKLYNEKMTTKLSNAALETLAIVAYKQPITRAEMEAIRGVDVAGPLERLLERGLVRVVGKKDTVGRPMVYGTTDEFLRMFGLNKISELPDLQVFATKTLHEKQADLPFGDPLPPLGEPGIIALEDLEESEKLEALGTPVDSFFTRNTYNRGELFVKDLAEGRPQENAETLPQEDAPGSPEGAVQPSADPASEAAAEDRAQVAASETAAGAAPVQETAGEAAAAKEPEKPAPSAAENTPSASDAEREAFLKQFGAPSDLAAWELPAAPAVTPSEGDHFASDELKSLETDLDAVLSQEAQDNLDNQAAALQAEQEENSVREDGHTDLEDNK